MSVSLKNIAETAGVHMSTVSLALRGDKRIAEKTRFDILRVADKLGYRPNYLAKGLAGGDTDSVGILLPKLHDTYILDYIGVQERFFWEHGIAPLVMVTHCDPQTEIKVIERLVGISVDALIVNYIPSSEEVKAYLKSLADNKKIISILGGSQISPGVGTVNLDLYDCGFEMTKHLISLGHSRIAFIVMDLGNPRQQRRLSGYCDALAEAGIKYDPRLVFEQDYILQDVRQLRQEIMSFKNRPTAICCYNDDMAAEFILELIQAGFKVPDEISMTGVNDGWYSNKTLVPLTTYRLPVEKIALTAAQNVLDAIEDKKVEPFNAVFKGELVVRESTKNVKN